MISANLKCNWFTGRELNRPIQLLLFDNQNQGICDLDSSTLICSVSSVYQRPPCVDTGYSWAALPVNAHQTNRSVLRVLGVRGALGPSGTQAYDLTWSPMKISRKKDAGDCLGESPLELSSLMDDNWIRCSPIKPAERQPSGFEPGKTCREIHFSNLALTRKEIYKWRCQNNCKGKCQTEI